MRRVSNRDCIYSTWESTSHTLNLVWGGAELKGQCYKIFLFWFFHQKQLLLVPLDTPWNHFNFFRILEELFIFVINSLVYSPPGSWDSPVYSSKRSHGSQVYSSLGSWDSQVYSPLGSQPQLVYKRTLLVQNTLGSQDFVVLNEYTGEFWFPGLLLTWKIVCKAVLMPVQSTLTSTSQST